MKVLVLTGPESSGKSWLANEIQTRFGGIVVDEYVRLFIEQQQRDTCYDDIEVIAQGQLALEDQARALAPELLILDTHLLSNILWSQTLFAAVPEGLHSQWLARHYDLHVLLDPRGVDWVDDGQRCQPQLDERLAFYQQCREELIKAGQNFVEVGGSWLERQKTVIDLVEALLKAPKSGNSTQI